MNFIPWNAALVLFRQTQEVRVDPYDLSWLVGYSLWGVENLENGSWRFDFGDEIVLFVSCPWRVILITGIIVSSEDHGQTYGNLAPVDSGIGAMSYLGGGSVTLAEVRTETRDIILGFGPGDRLEILPLSTGFESWRIVKPGGYEAVAQGGGAMVVWEGTGAGPT